jgi:GTP-binding protein
MADDGFSADELAAGQRLFAETWFFLKGVVGLEHLPGTDRPEIAFAGRSNVGKSSLINALVGVHGLARASNTPGRTQELNYFLPEGQSLYAVDLPGYGFAKAPKAKVEAWTSLIKDYLRGRPNLARVMLLVDSRHGIKTVDKEIMTLLDEAAVTYQIVLTKADKISELKIASVLRETQAALKKHAAAFPIVLVTSVETNTGIPDVRATIAGIAKENARIK